MRMDASTKRKHKTQATNTSTQGKHTTQALMGATRLASGKDVAIYLVEFVSPSFLYPDARRVAPIRGCVGCLSCVLALRSSVACLSTFTYLRFAGLLYIKVDRLASKRACQPVN